VSEAIARLASFLQLSDDMLVRAQRDDLQECVRILAIQRAHYKAKFGELPISDALDVLNNETMNDEQAKWIANGLEMVVGVLGMLEQEHPKH
jgi:hypothetical protein